jgi:kynurenine formamidase
MCGDLRQVLESLQDTGGRLVSKSPWGEDDHIGRLNWMTPERQAEVLSRLDGTKVIDLSVDFFKGMPSWIAAGDPVYDIWMTHTPEGAVIDGLAGVDPALLEKYSYAGDAFQMYTHCGTHLDMLNHFGHDGMFWNGWTQKTHLGSRHWLAGGAEHFPPIIGRAIVLDIAGLHGVECLEPVHEITAQELRDAAKRQGTEVRMGDIILIRTGRMTVWPDVQGYITDQPGVGLEGARWLAEEAGAMLVGSDSLSFEVVPNPDPETFLPVHSYLFATAGMPLMEVIDLEEVCREGLYEFAFMGFPLKLTGATGTPIRPVAIPLRS